MDGELVGVVMQSYSAASANTLTAVEISELMPVIDLLFADKEVPYFGVHISTVTQHIAQKYDIPKGIYIKKVEMDSPAMDAGLQSGDVIRSVAGQEVASAEQFREVLLQLTWFDGAQKPAPKKQIKFKREIQSVFYNNKYVGISYSDTKKENSWHIKVYDMNGKTVMENDTEIAYNRIELLDNNEICVRDDYNCELFTIHSIRKFRYTFDRQLYNVLSGSDGQNYTLVLNGEIEEVRLQ
jgi:hypothetical protein